MEDLLQKQKLAITTFQTFITNFGKAGKERLKNDTYLTNRLAELSEWWREFDKNNKGMERLMKISDEFANQTYFEQKFYERIKTSFESHQVKLNQYLQNIGSSSSTANVSPSSGDNDMSENELLNTSSVPANIATAGYVLLKNQLTELIEIFEAIRDMDRNASMSRLCLCTVGSVT